MLRIVLFNFSGGVLPLFIDDTETGYNGKDLITRPGAYEDVASENVSFPIAELQGGIDGYKTSMMGLVVNQQDGADASAVQIQDKTDSIKQLLTVPETAAKMLVQKMSQEDREFAQTALDVIHFYESVTKESKVFLPEEAFEFIDAETAKKMRSTRRVYVLKNTDNQEVIQKNCSDEYCVVLPHVDELHSDVGISPNALDILRVTFPNRREVSDGVYQYHGIYHTPYYKVDHKIRGMVPSYLSSITGYSKNDTLALQPFERHMFDNLYTFICSDTARYVAEICTGMLMLSPIGQKIRRLIFCKNSELMLSLITDISSMCGNGVECTITYSDLQEYTANGTTPESVARFVKQHLKVSIDYLMGLVETSGVMHRVIDTSGLQFVLDMSDDDKETMTAELIKNNIISRAVFEYVTQLCCRAYDVNWGHTGAADAIPGFVDKPYIDKLNETISTYLGSKIGALQNTSVNEDFSDLYNIPKRVSEFDDDEESDDEIYIGFNHYITDRVKQLIINNQLDPNFFSSGITGAETAEDRIVMYCREVGGDNNLNYFVSSAFMTTGDVKVLIECFIKLMRWGENKPMLLVLPDHPSIRTVFDLNVGKEIPNTAIVDESQLVYVNGCKHTLAGVLTAKDVIGQDNAVVGFVLAKDYGVKKYVLASWVDIGEMVENGDIDVAELKGVNTVNFTGEFVADISDYEHSSVQYYTSVKNIETGIQNNIKPEQLSELALLVIPGVLRSVEYLKSKQSTMVVTTRDRQYQILTSYVNTIRELYKQEGDTLRKDSISTVELTALAASAYKLYRSISSNQNPNANQVRAQQAIANMNLDVGGTPVIKYTDIPLVGKFTIISDVDMESSLPSIQFTEEAMKKLSQRVRDRIVLLMLETDDAYVLCRKDISQNELLVVDHKIEHRKYHIFVKLIDGLKAGNTMKINNAKTGVKKEAKLHVSLEGMI